MELREGVQTLGKKLGGGGEHIVYYDTKSGRIFKLTKPGFYGVHAKDAGAYLQRLALANRVFGDDLKFEGFVTLPGETEWRGRVGGPRQLGMAEPLQGSGEVRPIPKLVFPRHGAGISDIRGVEQDRGAESRLDFFDPGN